MASSCGCQPLSAAQKRQAIRGWYNEAVAAGTPFVEYLQTLSQEAQGESVSSGQVASASEAGQSVSFFGPEQSPVSSSDYLRFQADAAEEAIACQESLPPEATDQDILNCLLSKYPNADDARIVRKSYYGLRHCY